MKKVILILFIIPVLTGVLTVYCSSKKNNFGKQNNTSSETINTNGKHFFVLTSTSKTVSSSTTNKTINDNKVTPSHSEKRSAKVMCEFVNIPTVLLQDGKKSYNHSVIVYFDTYQNKKLNNEPLDLLIFLHGGDKGTPINLATPPEKAYRKDSIYAHKIIQNLYSNGKIDDTFVCIAPRMHLGSGNFINKGKENWGDFVAISLIQYMRLMYNCKGKVAITGICEGGMSSMKLIIWYPYTFSYVGSMSGFFFNSFIEDEYFFNFKNIEKVYIGIGKSDPFYQNNIKFDKILKEYCKNVFFDATKGSHPDFNLWRYELKQQILYFFGKEEVKKPL